jgi:hypothetical protein
MASEREKPIIEAYCRSLTLKNGAFKIIIQDNARNAAPGRKRCNMPVQKVLAAGIEIEPQKHLPRVTQDHDERHYRTLCASDNQVAKVSPVGLSLFPGQGFQAQESLGPGPWTEPCNGLANAGSTAGIAALADHGKHAAGRQPRVFLQHADNERQVWVELGGPAEASRGRHAALRQYPPHRVVVNAKLGGDRADRPLLGVMKAQDLRLYIKRNNHPGFLLSIEISHVLVGDRDGA